MRARAGVYEHVYPCGPRQLWKRGRCFGCCFLRGPPLQPALQRSFPVRATVEKGWKRKWNDCFSGRHWPIVNAACSFSWPATCIVVGLLVWGGQTAGGTAGGWWTAGPIWGEREESESIKERDERGEREVSVLWKSGKEEREGEGSRGDWGPCSSVTLCPLCSCVSALVQDWHIALHTGRHTVRK